MASGQNPVGEAFDVYEIIAPSVISAAISELELPRRSAWCGMRLRLRRLFPKNIQELKKSKTDRGNYTYWNIRRSIQAATNGGCPRCLEAVMKAYNVEYAEKYLNTYVLPRADFDISPERHDYIEVGEIMKDKADETIEYLEGSRLRTGTGRRKRAIPSSDRLKEYRLLKDVDISALYANILPGASHRTARCS